jgi:hypothetical protein
VAQSSNESRSARLLRACDDAIDRLGAKERAGTDPDTFAELGEALFWLFALAEANGRDSQGLLLGIKWARNRIAHGVVMAAPVRWRYGAEPGRLVLGMGMLGTASGLEWLPRSSVTLGPKDRPDARQEAAYDAIVAGRPVVEVLQEARALAK